MEKAEIFVDFRGRNYFKITFKKKEGGSIVEKTAAKHSLNHRTSPGASLFSALQEYVGRELTSTF